MFSTRIRPLLAKSAAGVMLASALLVATPGTAGADLGDCVTIAGKGGAKKNGYAKVCLVDFQGTKKGWAKLKVTKQVRKKAPNNVYVSVGFLYGGYNDGWRRLGKNSPKTYTKKQKASAAYPEQVRVRLCYDKTGRKDPCFSGKTLDPGWIDF